MLINLLSNAVKYTKEGGVVLRASPWQGSIDVRGRGHRRRDPGRPRRGGVRAVPPDPAPVGRCAARHRVSGLSISKQLVEVMGGDLLFDSREGHGTRVSFTLPQLTAVDAAPGRRRGAGRGPRPAGLGRAASRARPRSSRTTHASRYGLKSLLESEGYEVREAADSPRPTQVREQAARRCVDPRHHAARRRRRRVAQPQRATRARATSPVIALTGVTADEDTRRIAAAGARKVLTKPVKIEELLALLRDATNGTEKG